MSLTRPRSAIETKVIDARKHSWLDWLHGLLTSWDFYLILLLVLVAGFLRFYGINTTEFDDDQAMLFRLAYDAIHHGLLPVTSNRSSIGLANPPGAIYLLMLPAAISSNPMWGAVLVGACSVVAVVLTYIFTNRYFGRVAALVAALLYAVTFRSINYERFIWQPNLMAPFVILFMFLLFLGVVERRKGWLFPALLLLGILFQMHAITLLLVVPLALAIMLAPRTLRWRDLIFSVIGLLIIFFPFLLWEFSHKFVDLLSILPASGGRAVIDDQALRFYRLFLLPYDSPPTYPGSIQAHFAHWLSKLHLSLIMPLLVLGGALTAVVLMLWPSLFIGQAGNSASLRGNPDTVGAMPGARPPSPLRASTRHRPYEEADPAGTPVETEARTTQMAAKAPANGESGVAQLRAWWSAFYESDESGYRRGLLLLLVWQIVPLLALTRHSLDLHAQYFLFLLPGPFILIGLFIGQLAAWLRRFQPSLPPLQWARYALYFAVAILVIAQFVGSIGGVLDQVEGKYDDRSFQPYPYHNDLSSLQHALSEADQLAQQRHLGRVYITSDAATQTALGFLTEQMHTPTTLFDAGKCLVLPGAAEGPAVLLVGPYDTLTNALLGQFAQATLIDSPTRLAGAPFKLYIINMLAPSFSARFQAQLGSDLQLLTVQSAQLVINNSSWLVTRWQLLRTAPPALRTTYNYVFNAKPAGSNTTMQATCSLSSLQNGDQVLAAFPVPQGSASPASVTLSVQSYTTRPDNPTIGPLHVETYLSISTPAITLHTASGKIHVTASVTSS